MARVHPTERTSTSAHSWKQRQASPRYEQVSLEHGVGVCRGLIESDGRFFVPLQVHPLLWRSGSSFLGTLCQAFFAVRLNG